VSEVDENRGTLGGQADAEIAVCVWSSNGVTLREYRCDAARPSSLQHTRRFDLELWPPMVNAQLRNTTQHNTTQHNTTHQHGSIKPKGQ
jgi:hypothetical protein